MVSTPIGSCRSLRGRGELTGWGGVSVVVTEGTGVGTCYRVPGPIMLPVSSTGYLTKSTKVKPNQTPDHIFESGFVTGGYLTKSWRWVSKPYKKVCIMIYIQFYYFLPFSSLSSFLTLPSFLFFFIFFFSLTYLWTRSHSLLWVVNIMSFSLDCTCIRIFRFSLLSLDWDL